METDLTSPLLTVSCTTPVLCLPIELCEIPLFPSLSSPTKSPDTISGSTYVTNQHGNILKIPHIHTQETDPHFEILPTTIKALHNKNLLGERHIEMQCLNENGYVRKNTICDSLQGEIFLAETLNGQNVVIKKTLKNLHYQQLSINHGKVEENILKETLILQHLTMDNRPPNDCVIKFIKLFESDIAFYLVLEHLGNVTLADFTHKAHQLISQKKLKNKHWKQIIKYLMWQLAVIVYWLHNDMKCCHLDLCLQNIVVINGNFIENEKGTIDFDPNISIKLIDFGLSEIFNGGFKCNKYGERENHYLSAPEVYAENNVYDARNADIWSLGIILYKLATDLDLYRPQDAMGLKKITPPNTYHNLMELIILNAKSNNVNQRMVKLMADLLNIDENKRISAIDILQNEWMSLYYQQYKAKIEKKSKFQLLRNINFINKMDTFPFYNIMP